MHAPHALSLLAAAALPLLVAAGCGSTVAVTGAQGATTGTGGHGGSTTHATSSAHTGTGGHGGEGAGLPAYACRNDDDCTKYNAQGPLYGCAAPGSPPGCGICQMVPGACATDADCKAQGDATICVPVACACAPTDTKCVPGCASDAACSADQVCDATHRCAPKPCSTSAGCPANFFCGADLRCTRDACTTDADCAGHCVEGACYDDFGVCTPLVA